MPGKSRGDCRGRFVALGSAPSSGELADRELPLRAVVVRDRSVADLGPVALRGFVSESGTSSSGSMLIGIGSMSGSDSIRGLVRRGAGPGVVRNGDRPSDGIGALAPAGDRDSGVAAPLAVTPGRLPGPVTPGITSIGRT